MLKRMIKKNKNHKELGDERGSYKIKTDWKII